MLKAAVVIDVDGTEQNLNQATVADAINLTELFYQQERKDILQDLKDANATSTERLDRLRTHAEQRGMATFLARCAMRTDRARIIVTTTNADSGDWIDGMPPLQLCEVALRLLGHDFDETEANSENPQTATEKNP